MLLLPCFESSTASATTLLTKQTRAAAVQTVDGGQSKATRDAEFGVRLK